MSDALISALELSIPCFLAFPFAFFGIASWELQRESARTKYGLPIAADIVMLIYVLILAFFVSLALMATTILIGFVGFTMPIPPAGLVVIGVLTGCLSALLHLLRDIIDMTLFIGEPKGSDVSRLVYAFVPPITVPVLASIIATI